MSLIYLDYAATTPLSQSVRKVLLNCINDDKYFFNSGSSTYEQAEFVKSEIEKARLNIAETLKVIPREIIFTSGATESNNLAIKGVAFSYREKGNHIITSKAEHKAVLDVCRFLETQGFYVTYLEVDRFGEINIEELKSAISERTLLVSLMAVNNELGTRNNLIEIGKLTREKNVLFHVDAAQGYGKVDIDVNNMNIDLLSVSGHKIYAPKGIGFLYVSSKRPKVKLLKQIHGGTQEFALRAGTLPNYQILALATACKEITLDKSKNYLYIRELRDLFLEQLQDLDGVRLNTNLENSYPGILSLTFMGVKGEALLAMLDGICLSMGSACNSQAIEPSHVLTAIGLLPNDAESTVRVSFGLQLSKQEVVNAANNIRDKVKLLRAIAPE